MSTNPEDSDRKSVLIVDDHPITRDGLAALLGREPGLRVSGQAGTAKAALEELAREEPDLVLLDLNLPDKDGLELLKDIRALHPSVPVLALSMHNEDIYATRVLRAGARGYVMKREGGERVLEAVRQVLAGRIAVSPEITESVIGTAFGRKPGVPQEPESQLTDRELEVMRLFGSGWSKDEIARHLNIAAMTVDVHRFNIRKRLNLRHNSDFLRRAIAWVAAEGG